MAKPIKAIVKVQLEGGSAKPSPPLGPALGQHGVAIMDFCRDFNAKTQDRAGQVLPTVITIYDDRSFDYVVKSSPAAVLLMKAAGLERAAASRRRSRSARSHGGSAKRSPRSRRPTSMRRTSKPRRR